MSTDPDTPSADRRADSETDTFAPRTLDSVVVEYDERPDRRTLYPDGASGIERMATWLTADADAFVDLETRR